MSPGLGVVHSRGGAARRWLALVVVVYAAIALVGAVFAAPVVANLPEDPVAGPGGRLEVRVGPACGADVTPPGVACFESVNVTIQEVGEPARSVELGQPSVTTGDWAATVRAATAKVEVAFDTDLGSSSVVAYAPESDRVFVSMGAEDQVARSTSPPVPPPRATAQALLFVGAALALVLLVVGWQWFRTDSFVWGRRTMWVLVPMLVVAFVAPFLVGGLASPGNASFRVVVLGALLAVTWRWVVRRRQRMELARREGPPPVIPS